MSSRSNVRTTIVRAVFVALVPLTICVQGALAHASPVSQTLRNGATVTAFSGTFDVVWSLRVLTVGAVIELRDALNRPLLQATADAAIEENVQCPGFTVTFTCTRISLAEIPSLDPGSYAMFWRVRHLDGYVEQRVVRFTVDPAWVPPSPRVPPPSPTVSPLPSPTPIPTVNSSVRPSAAPSPVATATPVETPPSSPTDPSPTVAPTPIPSAGSTADPDSGVGFEAVAGLLIAVGLAALLLCSVRSAVRL